MRPVEHFLPLEIERKPRWQRYALDTLFAFVGSMLVTGVIFVWQLYPRIPNISIVYLLVVLALASTRGRYAAILASLVAFLAFDFFLVPPLYVFTINRIEEWIALFVFLVTAILTSQLAAALRERAEQAARREQETRILYDLVRVTTREEKPERQLQAIVQSIVEVFASWGVRDCAVLQADGTGTFCVQASANQPREQMILSSDEKAVATWVMKHGRTMGLYEDSSFSPSPSAPFVQRILTHTTWGGRVPQRSLLLIPLNVGQKIVGVLRLRMLADPRRLPYDERLEEEDEHPNVRTAFFRTFLDQASSLIERARLQHENMHIAILQRTDALRAALLSSVSHDLRTPLTAIKAAASSLLQEDVSWDEEARRSFARSIEREADRLNRLVSNLLDMSRIEGGALKPEKDWYSLKMLIHEVVGRLEPLLEGRTVHTNLPDDLLMIDLDYVQIDQVLTNLLENALRYTPPESPIEIEAHIEGEQVLLTVADRGPGIPTSDLERVFDKFYRVLHGQHSAGYPMGSGLGLAVCKGVVEAHGGRVWAVQREGGGLAVRVVLPVGEQERIVA
ncbi:MAG TPA: ATP-binding protein [Ktedonobacteraceae bacterium]|nr:ATP-binding protein [Ktedonobacteraceae bacterium]